MRTSSSILYNPHLYFEYIHIIIYLGQKIN
uniref:Uncharacterized protein n=1 Tax=Siphoviridae sp. ctiOl67 TaxID=2825622 RepID=A0A8S5QJ16_9CAUD|nr:MAG TPA: hypothetical protein [Siphoviridae sp. ctiOl67]